jgi:CDGSH-type Zn-finger protein
VQDATKAPNSPEYRYICRDCGRSSEKPYSMCTHCMTSNMSAFLMAHCRKDFVGPIV